MHKTAFVDNQLAARAFHTDDSVRKAGQRGLLLSPYVGRVVFSNTETGYVQVQWPWGVEQEVATELIKDTSGDLLPPEYCQVVGSAMPLNCRVLADGSARMVMARAPRSTQGACRTRISR